MKTNNHKTYTNNTKTKKKTKKAAASEAAERELRHRAEAWVFIKGGCSRRGVQWMGLAL